MNTGRELSYREFIMRENNAFHAPYYPEFAFYIAVKNGEVNKVSQLCRNEFSEKSGFGKLSDNPLQNMKYHFVVTAALIARHCIEGRMDHETAYSLSDIYIQKADSCTTIAQISRLHTEMTMDYTQRMKQIRKKQIFSRQIEKCVDYIYNNLHKRIPITELARHVELNPSYLSRLFRKETGVTITAYIQDRKIETARNMLQFSNYLPSQIATILAFPSQSYFIEVFRRKTGLTPKKYRDTCFRETGLSNVQRSV